MLILFNEVLYCDPPPALSSHNGIKIKQRIKKGMRGKNERGMYPKEWLNSFAEAKVVRQVSKYQLIAKSMAK